MLEKELTLFLDSLSHKSKLRLHKKPNGNLFTWESIVEKIPKIPTNIFFINDGVVQIGGDGESTSEQKLLLKKLFLQLNPWRKGPFLLHTILIDSEWRSDFKWNRLQNHISPLIGRKVLDIGCGNGYFCWRMAFQNPKIVIGIDPSQLFHMQFLAIKKLSNFFNEKKIIVDKVWHFPLGIEDLPMGSICFDTIFSMGVLYHRKFPEEHLKTIKQLLRPGGELVLETLILDEAGCKVLKPRDRYASMRNVWSIPSIQQLYVWLNNSGYKDINLIDVTVTTTEEQRSTKWMQFYSLKDFLNKNDSRYTIEGHPAPLRAIICAKT